MRSAPSLASTAVDVAPAPQAACAAPSDDESYLTSLSPGRKHAQPSEGDHTPPSALVREAYYDEAYLFYEQPAPPEPAALEREPAEPLLGQSKCGSKHETDLILLSLASEESEERTLYLAKSEPSNEWHDLPIFTSSPVDAISQKSRWPATSMDLPRYDKVTASEEVPSPVEEDEQHGEWHPLSAVPLEVRVSVPNDDDPEMPFNTLRVWLMAVPIAVLLAWAIFELDVNVTSGNGSLIVGAVLVQPLCFGLGMLLSYLPYPAHWPFAHFINPGPFNLKEHTIITIVATVVTGPNLALRYIGLMSMTPCRLNLSEEGQCEQQGIFPVGFLGLLNLSSPLLGLALAGLSEPVLVRPCKMTWPNELQTAAMLTALHGVRRPNWSPTKVFYSLVGISLAWEFVPQRLFTELNTFSWPTWIAPHSFGVNLIFGGFAGLGLSFVSLDWWSISAALGSPLIPPLYAVVNTFAGWLLGPCFVALILLLTNTQGSAHLPLNSPEPFYDNTGQVYRFKGLEPTMINATSSVVALSRSLTVNQTAFDAYSYAYLTPGSAVAIAFSFAAASALLVHTVLFHWSDFSPSAWSDARVEDDHHAKLLRSYPAVPMWWHAVLLVVCVALAIPMVHVYETGMPVWGLFIALGFSLLFLIPSGLLKGMTARQVTLDNPASLLAGAMFDKSLATPLFWLYSTATVQQAMLFLGCGKLGHYFKIPPRICLLVQGGAQVITSLVHWGLWVRRGSKPVTQRSGCMRSMAAEVLYWGALRPHRTILRTHPWTLLFILVGAILPLLVYLVRRVGVRRLWGCNVERICFPLVLSTATSWPSNWSISFPSWFTARMLFECLFGRRTQMNYWCGLSLIVSAGLSVGTTITVALVALIWPHGGFKWYLPSPLDRAIEIGQGTGIVWKPLPPGQAFALPPGAVPVFCISSCSIKIYP